MKGGGQVDLAEYPRLRRYLERYREVIAGRHCARRNLVYWYRTIDRITPSLARQAKLLIPDIKGEAHVVFERGELYPHHNLYYVTSDARDLRAMQAVLLSAITRLFVATYSTKMRRRSIWSNTNPRPARRCAASGATATRPGASGPKPASPIRANAPE